MNIICLSVSGCVILCGFYWCHFEYHLVSKIIFQQSPELEEILDTTYTMRKASSCYQRQTSV